MLADYIILLVGSNFPHKGAGRLVQAFARAWQQAGSLSNSTPGRLLLVCIGPGMPGLEKEVQQAWAELQRAAQQGSTTAASATDDLPAAIHLLDSTVNATERLGWYAAADVQVLNSGGCCDAVSGVMGWRQFGWLACPVRLAGESYVTCIKHAQCVDRVRVLWTRFS